MHVIYSSKLKGAGCVSGGPYHTGKIFDVRTESKELVANSVKSMNDNFVEALVDDPKNLKGAPVYVGIHTEDTIVLPNL